jgi:carboxyl-terminal processing protease
VGSRILQVNGHPPIPYEAMDAYPPCNSKEIDTSTREYLLLDRKGESLEIEVERVRFTSGTDPYIPPQGWRIGDDERGIGYLELILETGVHSRYPTDVQYLMRNHDHTPVCGWILDLRRNPGGDIWSYIAAVGPILGEGDLGGFEYLDGRREMWTYRNGEVLWNNEYREESEIDGTIYIPKRVTPVALLISPATQAAGELLLVAFQGRPDVRSFGEPTRGLPVLVTQTELSDGSTLFVSGANSFDRNGTIYSGPLQPDVIVQTDWSRFGTQQDPVVQAAIEWLHAQSSCAR